MELMKKIPLTKRKFAIVDDGDFELLSQWKWWSDQQGYAVRDAGGRKNKHRILMHRLLNETPAGLVTDHINRNKLDNRKSNLRSVSQRQNTLNCKLSKNNTSGHNGISWYKNRWVATFTLKYKKIYLGRFLELKDALMARSKAEIQYHAI
jgi:hypothetical protein